MASLPAALELMEFAADGMSVFTSHRISDHLVVQQKWPHFCANELPCRRLNTCVDYSSPPHDTTARQPG